MNLKTRCLFCGIIGEETSSYSVFEDEISLAFLDHRPLFPGHCLLVPRGHYETLTDLPEDLTGLFFRNVQLLSRVVEEAMEAEGSFVALNNRVSQSVLHLHVHVVPRNRGDGLKGFFWPRHPYSGEDDIRRVQARILAVLNRIRET